MQFPRVPGPHDSFVLGSLGLPWKSGTRVQIREFLRTWPNEQCWWSDVASKLLLNFWTGSFPKRKRWPVGSHKLRHLQLLRICCSEFYKNCAVASGKSLTFGHLHKLHIVLWWMHRNEFGNGEFLEQKRIFQGKGHFCLPVCFLDMCAQWDKEKWEHGNDELKYCYLSITSTTISGFCNCTYLVATFSCNHV